MSLDEAVLQKLADWRPATGRQTLHVTTPDAGWALVLTVDRADPLGCLVWDFELRRTEPDASDGDQLAAWAGRVAGRVTGLLEPLKVVEVDRPRGQALLRSEAPVSRGDDLFYYEVLLTGTRLASLRRFRAPSKGPGPREQISFALTHEALAKLAGDFAAAE
jgi:hypothetical protein